jgi:Icc-related predicted phosphoesterase
MKIQYFSDIHMEFNSKFPNIRDDVDILIIAGDLHNSKGIIKTLKEIDKTIKIPVIFVPGNHEYYGNQKANVDYQFSELTKNLNNVFILNNKVIYLQGITFIGGTAFWDGSGGRLSKQVIYTMNDFSTIYDCISNNYGLSWGFESRKFFERSMFEAWLSKTPTICVSHNAPTLDSIQPEFRSSELNVCFANDWRHLITQFQPNIWIHGHMHQSIDYMIGETRILCNPYGYETGEINKTFNPNEVIEI